MKRHHIIFTLLSIFKSLHADTTVIISFNDSRVELKDLHNYNRLRVNIARLNRSWDLSLASDLFIPRIPVYTRKNRTLVSTLLQAADRYRYYHGADDYDVCLKVYVLTNTFDLHASCSDVVYVMSLTRRESAGRYLVGFQTLVENKTEIMKFQRKFAPIPYISQLVRNEIYATRRMKRSTYDSLLVRYIELFLIVDNELHGQFNYDVETTYARCLDLINAVDTIYRAIGLRVVLVGIEVWNEGDQISFGTNENKVLEQFAIYSNKNFPHVDNVHLLTSKDFNEVIGLAYVGSMCMLEYSAGFSRYLTSMHYSFTAVTVAHEIGHNLNMKHDDSLSEKCLCNDRFGVCIMYSSLIHLPQRMFSSCSVKLLESYVDRGYATCLENPPEDGLKIAATCGNNVLDDGEECDCGMETFCTNKCCDPNSCKIVSQGQCADGACCDEECRFASNNTMCRHNTNECDLYDFCTGESSKCTDLFKMNGASCSHGMGVCYDGVCHSKNNQCVAMWGKNAQVSHSACFLALNQLGVYYANCGLVEGTRNTYVSCNASDSMCGTLFCNISDGTGSDLSYIRTKVEFYNNGTLETCMSRMGDERKQCAKDIGLVEDWTPCGENRYCVDNKCVTKNISEKCNPECNGTKICTNIGSCACPNGWSGVHCNRTIKVPDGLHNFTHGLYEERSSGETYKTVNSILIAVFLINIVL